MNKYTAKKKLVLDEVPVGAGDGASDGLSPGDIVMQYDVANGTSYNFVPSRFSFYRYYKHPYDVLCFVVPQLRDYSELFSNNMTNVYDAATGQQYFFLEFKS